MQIALVTKMMKKKTCRMIKGTGAMNVVLNNYLTKTQNDCGIETDQMTNLKRSRTMKGGKTVNLMFQLIKREFQ